MIYVTHDQVEAMTLADRIVVLNAGRIEQVGTPLELYHRPANLFVAGFIGSPQMKELGENHLLYVDVGGGRRLTVREPGDARHEVGSTVTLNLARESCHLFRSSGEALRPRAGATSPTPSSPDVTSMQLKSRVIPGRSVSGGEGNP